MMSKSHLVHEGSYMYWFVLGSLPLRGSTYKPMLFTNINAIPATGITLVIRLVHSMLELPSMLPNLPVSQKPIGVLNVLRL